MLPERLLLPLPTLAVQVIEDRLVLTCETAIGVLLPALVDDVPRRGLLLAGEVCAVEVGSGFRLRRAAVTVGVDVGLQIGVLIHRESYPNRRDVLGVVVDVGYERLRIRLRNDVLQCTDIQLTGGGLRIRSRGQG